MIELVIRHTNTGKVLAQIVLDSTAPNGILNIMRPQEAARTDAVAGRIEATAEEFSAAVAKWSEYMRSLGKRESSIRAFTQVLKAAQLAMGWRSPADATWADVTAYMASKRESEAWKGTTYNRNLSAFRSFSKWWASRNGSPDPLVGVRRADDDGGDGSRAATVDEARALIRYALERQGDARCKGNRALYWYCLFAVGARHDEPAKWLWKHLHLDSPPAWIDWARGIQKNKKHQPTAIAPRVAELLRKHRERVPHGPDDPVFPITPPRTTFRADRNAVGIPALDDRGRAFTPQSARKAFSTILTAAGVPEKMVDRLMRHTGRVEHRYFDPTLAEQEKAAAQMPELWPVSENLDSTERKDLTSGGGSPMMSLATRIRNR